MARQVASTCDSHADLHDCAEVRDGGRDAGDGVSGGPSNPTGTDRAIAAVLAACFLVAVIVCGVFLPPGDTGVVTFGGAVESGAVFRRRFGPDLSFRLDPIDHGWVLSVRADGRKDDLSRLTTPFHSVPNPRDIEGWHFRNADNTGPNQAGPLNVNAPQTVREFVFAPHVTSETPKTTEEVERARAAGRGRLQIRRYTLSPPSPGERARMLSMEFEVELRWKFGD
jgi:hypothetical protein